MDLIDRLRTYASTRKGELAELITEAADALERQTCEDAVSRADVLETYADLYDVFEDSRAICKELHKVYDRINALPAVQSQPEIIRCKECKHRDPEDKKCDCGHDILWQLPRDDNWFCADAERRTDGKNT